MNHVHKSHQEEEGSFHHGPSERDNGPSALLRDPWPLPPLAPPLLSAEHGARREKFFIVRRPPGGDYSLPRGSCPRPGNRAGAAGATRRSQCLQCLPARLGAFGAAVASRVINRN